LSDISPKTSKMKIQPVRVSHVLTVIAGDLAPDIAECWPFPHSLFLERAGPWMHIAAMVISNPVASNQNARIAFQSTSCWKSGAEFADARFTAHNRCILKSLSLPLWMKRDYRNLSGLLDSENSLKVMKHRSNVSPELVNVLHALPDEFRINAIVRHLRSEKEARILNRIATADGTTSSSLLNKLSTASDAKDFWNKASMFFVDRCARFPSPPAIDDPRVKPLLSAEELRSHGTHLRLCLRNLLGEALSGEQAFYLFSGTEPVVVSLSPRIGANPVIDQMSGPDNNPVSDVDRGAIVDIFNRAGIRDESNFVCQWPSELDRRLQRLGGDNDHRPAMAMHDKINELIEMGMRHTGHGLSHQ